MTMHEIIIPALVATTNIDRLLSPPPTSTRQPMKGFDPEFIDIADYIVRITDRIWHERRVDLCLDYYTNDCVIHTLTGDIVGARTVEANTHATLAAFPDRTLDPDNVIWSVEADDVFYSSHLITSRMTNLGPGEFGPPTGKRARIRTIADCLCRDNRIFEEWLVRDNGALVRQMDGDIAATAHRQAANDHATGRNWQLFFADARANILNKTIARAAGMAPAPETDPEAFARIAIETAWPRNDEREIASLYDFRVAAHLPSGREFYGTLEYREYLSALNAALPDLKASVDHVASIPYLGAARDIAVRWSLAGTHLGDGLFGAATGAQVYILGISHWRIINGRIREEWTVYDELAVLRQTAGAAYR